MTRGERAGVALTRKQIERPPQAAMPSSTVVGRLARVMAAAVDVLHVDSVGLMLADERDELRAVGSTDPAVAELEAAQIRVRQGPGWDTAQHGHTVAVADLRTEPAYSELSAALAETGVRAVLSCPVVVADQVVGNFNLVRRQPRAWTDADVRAAEAYGRVIATTLRLSVQSGVAFGADPAQDRWREGGPVGDTTTEEVGRADPPPASARDVRADETR